MIELTEELLELEKELCNAAVECIKESYPSHSYVPDSETGSMELADVTSGRTAHTYVENRLKLIYCVAVQWEESCQEEQEYIVRIVADVEIATIYTNGAGVEGEPEHSTETEYLYVEVVESASDGELIAEMSERRDK